MVFCRVCFSWLGCPSGFWAKLRRRAFFYGAPCVCWILLVFMCVYVFDSCCLYYYVAGMCHCYWKPKPTTLYLSHALLIPGGDVVVVLHGINHLHSYFYDIPTLSLFSPHIMCMGLRHLLLLHVCMATGYIMLVGGGPLIAHSTSL